MITVHLASGKMFAGAVDSRTDGDWLWLRVDKGAMSVLRPISRHCIAKAVSGDQALTGDELFARLESLKSSRTKIETSASAYARSVDGARDTKSRLQTDLPDESDRSAFVPPLQSLQVEAAIRTWSRGVESDGIELDVLPLDAQGCLTLAEGALEVDLFGDQSGSPTRGRDYRLLGHWVVKLDATKITPNGARFRLPFQAISPDFNTDLSPYCLVHVRLVAPGQGVFDATSGITRLRRYNGLRDRLQQTTGARFFPQERTDRGRWEHQDW